MKSLTHPLSTEEHVEHHHGRLARIAAVCGAISFTAMAGMTLLTLRGDGVVPGTATMWLVTMTLAAATYTAGIWLERRNQS